MAAQAVRPHQPVHLPARCCNNSRLRHLRSAAAGGPIRQMLRSPQLPRCDARIAQSHCEPPRSRRIPSKTSQSTSCNQKQR